MNTTAVVSALATVPHTLVLPALGPLPPHTPFLSNSKRKLNLPLRLKLVGGESISHQAFVSRLSGL